MLLKEELYGVCKRLGEANKEDFVGALSELSIGKELSLEEGIKGHCQQRCKGAKEGV